MVVLEESIGSVAAPKQFSGRILSTLERCEMSIQCNAIQSTNDCQAGNQ